MWLWKYLTRPKAGETVKIAPTRRELDLRPLPLSTTPGFIELLKVADATEIEFPNLKSVAAAQWALECGWGTSALAREHHNYGGAKWRPWCKPYGKPVQYTAWDGPDTYVSFNSDADFIAAYWKRLDVTSAYSGWRFKTDTPAAFMSHIGPPWVGVSDAHAKAYVRRVLDIHANTMSKVFSD